MSLLNYSLVLYAARFVEIYLTGPLPQHQLNSKIMTDDGNAGIRETTMVIDDSKAENERISSHHGAAEKRQQPGASRASGALQTSVHEHVG